MAKPSFSNYISKRTGGPQAFIVGFEIEGLEQAVANVWEYGLEGPKAMGRALYAEALLIMAVAKKLTPVRYGFLRASGRVDVPQITLSTISVEMGFGGPAGTGNLGETNKQDVGYALPVHENLSAHHPVGQAKFLEQPALSMAANLEKNLAIRIKADLNL